MAVSKRVEFGVYRIQGTSTNNGWNENLQAVYRVGIFPTEEEAERRVAEMMDAGENGPITILVMSTYVRIPD